MIYVKNENPNIEYEISTDPPASFYRAAEEAANGGQEAAVEGL